MDFHENDLISLYLSELKKIEDFNSTKQKIQLYSHSQLGKVLIINDEIQHIEKYQALYHELLVHLPTAFIPEIRNVLEQLGRSQLLGRHKVLTVDEREKMVYEITNAMDYLKKSRIGALITIERDNSLNDYIEKSKKIYADISSDLLISIFFPNNPLHDGAVIIQGDKITSAGAVFPTSDNVKISKRLGTRHRAALGITEEMDCISLIVSEETGRLSMAIGGELYYNLTLDEVKIKLLDELRPKKMIFDEDVENAEEETHEENN